MIGARKGKEDCAGVQSTGGSCGQRRPDASWVCNDKVVYLEVDEDSHAGRETSCELSKVDETAFSQISPQDSTLLRGVFIRFNPDAYDLEDICLADRVEHLAMVIEEECLRDALTLQRPRVVFMYYNSKAYKHIKAAESAFDVVVLPHTDKDE